MDGRISMYVLLVCVWYSLDAGGFLVVVTAQPAVSAVILTPEADRKEGGQVDMRCFATNLESNHTVEWRTEHETLRWGGATFSNVNGRSIFDTSVDMATRTVVQDFTITNVQRTDTDEYVCNVNDPIQGGGADIVVTSSVTLSVLYFPSESFPMCSPSGPITADAGTESHMTCSSESSHGTVTMTINPTIQTTRYTWASVINDDNDTIVRTLSLTVDDDDNGVAFDCVIASMYFTTVQRTCQIGPITVRDTMTEPTTLEQITTAWIIAFIVVLVFAATFFVITVILFFHNVRKNRLIKRLESEKEPRVTKPDPYMELQPTEDKNRVYMEPTQDTYYQPVEVENESPEHDYAQPEDSTTTSYEAVRVPQSSAEKQYQNINN